MTGATLTTLTVLALAATPTPPPRAAVVAPRAPGAASGSPQSSANTPVTAITVTPGADGAEILVAAGAQATVRHFRLASPFRVVVDLAASALALQGGYDGLARGPVRNIRLSQFRRDTVRLVIDLDSARSYRVERAAGMVRVVVVAPDAAFPRWGMSAGDGAARTAATPKPEAPKPEAPKPEAPKPEAPKPEAPKPEAKPAPSDKPTPAPKPAPSPTPAPAAKPAPTPAPPPAPAPKPEPRQAATPVVDPSTLPLARRVPLTGDGAPAPSLAPQKPRISVTFDDTPIRDVVALFAKFSRRSIILGKNVTGNVTADIADKPWDVALQAILQAQQLAASEDASGLITVDSYQALAATQALEPLVTQVIEINYARATTLRTTVQALLTRDCTGLGSATSSRDPGMGGSQQGGGAGQQGGAGCVVRGSVAADSATNRLIITEAPSRLPEIVARIKQLDFRTPQVTIKAKIVFVNRTGIQDIGLAYDLGTGNKQFFQQLVPRTDPNTLRPVDTNGDGVPDATGGGSPYQGPARIALGGNALAGIANANNAIKPNALNLIYSTALGRYQLTAFLNALQTSSLADVQSEPSVTIVNNRNAEIFVGQEIPIRVIDASAGSGGMGGGMGGGGGGGGGMQPNAAAFFPRATVTKEEAGIKLSVTPQITNNRMVLMTIKAENSSAEVSATDVGVIFNRQRAESQVLVSDGEAAVIGGLTVTETTRFRTGIPLLMDLPLLGRFFGQTSRTETKRDLLILVTPHILEDGPVPPPGR
ncbi:MAG: AMIN domain-containing protein [Gemmatimonadetes bacterium]|nr:AMIN domain-containing protein [Gemmatimonadota bacterium]